MALDPSTREKNQGIFSGLSRTLLSVLSGTFSDIFRACEALLNS